VFGYLDRQQVEPQRNWKLEPFDNLRFSSSKLQTLIRDASSPRLIQYRAEKCNTQAYIKNSYLTQTSSCKISTSASRNPLTLKS